MKVWLYAAASSKADADRTYELACSHGIIWRSYYANRRPATAIPNVKHLRPGDRLYLGYREQGAIRLLGRMTIGRPDHPLRESPVFTAAPDEIVPEFAIDYLPDPILGQFVGIFVEQVRPISGHLESPGRFTISELEEPVIS